MKIREIPTKPVTIEKIWLKGVLPSFLKRDKFPYLTFEKAPVEGAKGTALADYKTYCTYIIHLDFSSN